MGRDRCETCGGLGGPAGPCPECGELPAVEVVGLSETTPSEPTRVTTPVTARRTALVVVGLLVGLVALSMAWEGSRGGDDAAAGEAEETEERDAATTSTTVRRRRTPTTPTTRRPVDEVPVGGLSQPVAGFEGEWLLVVGGASGAWSVPLDGGPPVQLGHVAEGEREYLVDGALVGYQGAISLRDGSTWRFDLVELDEEEGAVQMRMGWLLGISDDETVIWADDFSFAELAVDGTVLGVHEVPPSMAGWGLWPRTVQRRQALFEGPHGLVAADLDTGDVRRLAVGTYVAAAGDHVVVEQCDDRMRCEVALIDVRSGAQVLTLEVDRPRPPTTQAMRMVYAEPSVSPDDERLVMFDGDQALQFVDLTTGRRLGSVSIPDGLLDPEPYGPREIRVVWSNDSDAALVVVTGHAGPPEERPVVHLATVDRDGTEAVPNDELGGLVRALARNQGSLRLFVTTEPGNPWMSR